MHILAVDDDPIILELLEEFIRHLGGHTLETALSATDALDLVARPDHQPFDCFLLDIQMPGTDGIQLCDILRSRPDHLDTPILMLTAMSEKSYIDRAFAVGASDYITKPFDLSDLQGRLGLVASIVAERRATLVPQDILARAANRGEIEPGHKMPLHIPMAVPDIENVIEHHALENYVTLLSRNELFGSTTFGFCIRDIQALYESTDDFEYQCLVTDVSEAIASSIEAHQYLVSYAGNGVFVCIAEQGWQPDPAALTDRINLTLHHMELSYNNGQRMEVAVSAGQVTRLVWKSGEKAIEALAAAYDSAEQESRKYTRNMQDFWFHRHSA